MKILSMDVSTTATGAVIYDQKTTTHIHKLFESSKKNSSDRIKEIAKMIFEWIKEKEFDLVLITKAGGAATIPSILQLEGILLSIAISRDVGIDYFPDVSWYSLMGNVTDERPTKKKKSVERFINKNNLNAVHARAIWKSRNLSKIIVKLDSGETITDDIADAWNAAELFEKRQLRNEVNQVKSETQKKLNKLRSVNKKMRGKIPIIKGKIKNYKSEIINYKDANLIKESKINTNAIAKRETRIIDAQNEIELIEKMINQNNDDIKKLMNKKNNL